MEKQTVTTNSESPIARTRLLRLTIEGFRGFRDAATLDFNASAVLLWGPNGTGKTSVFDAIAWLLVGDVSRLRGYTLRRTDEYLTNIYRSDAPARVEAEFDIRGDILRAWRIGNSRGSRLEISGASGSHTGIDAEQLLEASLVRGELALSEVLATSGLLQQDELRYLLRTRPDERYRRLLRLLGLDALEGFDRFAAAERDRARAELRKSSAAMERLRADATRLQERLETSRLQVDLGAEKPLDISGLTAAASEFSDVVEILEMPTDAEEAAALAASSRACAGQVDEIRDELMTLPDVLPSSPEEELKTVREHSAVADASVQAARQRQSDAQVLVRQADAAQNAVGRLVAAALPFLAVDETSGLCPVCGSPINPGEVAAALSARAESATSVALGRASLATADQDVDQASAELAEWMRREAELRKVADTRRQVARSLQRLLRLLEGLPTALSTPTVRVVAGVGPGYAGAASDDDAVFSMWLEVRAPRLQTLDRLSEAFSRLAATADTAAAARTAARLAAERAAALPRQQAQFAEVEARLRAESQAYERARRAEAAASSLARRATAAVAELFRERFAALEPLMNDIYARLDPHPAFKRLDFRVETYRAKGTATASVIDDDEDIEANPMLVFSSAQANAVVVSAFLALGWAAGDRGLPFVLLDDPLQAMDDVNVLGFGDLVRHLRRQRQTVVATHEERFAGLLERKLVGRGEDEELIVHEFLNWSRGGPLIETRHVSARPDLRLRVLAS